MNIKISKTSVNIILLSIILFINCDFFYLVDSKSKFLSLKYSDYAMLATGLILCCMYMNHRRYKIESCFVTFAILGVMLVFTSSIQCWINIEQPIIMGIRVQRTFLVWMIFYVLLSKIIKIENIQYDQIVKMIVFLATVELILFYIQYFLGANHIFLHVLTGTRYGESRYYYNPFLLELLYFIKLDSILRKKNIIIDYVYIVLVVYEIMVIQKYRMTFMGLLFSTAMIVLFSRGYTYRKIFLVVLGIIGLIFISKTRMFNDIINTIISSLNTTSISSDNRNLKIREIGRTYYGSVLRQHPLLGAGYPNEESYHRAAVFSGYTRTIFLSDNGVFAFSFIYGLVGLLWVVTWFGKIICKSFKLMEDKVKGTSSIMGICMLFAFTSIQEIHWYWGHGIVIFVFFLLMVESKMCSINK